MDYKSLKNIPGGKIINECILIDNTMNPFKSILPVDSQSDIESWLRLAVKETIKKGITGVHDAWQDGVVINTIKELVKKNKFPLRCYGMLAGSDKKLLKTFFNQGHYNNEYLSIRSVKAFIDAETRLVASSILDIFTLIFSPIETKSEGFFTLP